MSPFSEGAESELQRRRWRVLLLTSVGAFMGPLDASIVAVALPAIGPSLHLSFTEALWVQASYLLAISIFLIPAGRIADMRGRLRFYMLGVVIFGLASVAAALSPSGSWLIIARTVQGIGGALLGATSAAVVTAVFPPQERGRALGINVMAVYIGLTAGPPLGGLLVTHLSWHWIFLVNAPIALVTLATGWNLLGAEARDRAAVVGGHGALADVDILGASLLGLMLATLFVPLTFSLVWGWTSVATIGLLIVSGVSLVAFILVENRVAHPILDLDLVRKNRLFAAANFAALLNYMAMYGIAVFTALFLEIVQGRTAQTAGFILLAEPIIMAALSPVFGRLSDRLGSRLLATTGMVLVAVGMAQLALLPTDASLQRILVALVTVGLGMAAFSAPNTSAVMGSVPRSQLSLASGFLGTMRVVGQGVSVTLLGAVAASHLGADGGRVILSHGAVGQATALAYAQGYRQAMLLGAALALVGAGVSLVRGAKPAAHVAPGAPADAPTGPGGR
jgi:EmrB/QacA subfamily drug resistance transporter